MIKYLIEEDSIFYHKNIFYKLKKRYDNYCIVNTIIWHPIGYQVIKEENQIYKSDNPYLWESK